VNIENRDQPTTILCFTPAFVDNDRHMAMIRLQSLLKPRLRRHLPSNIQFISALVVDYVHPWYAKELHGMSMQFDLCIHCDPPHKHENFGIRRPTTQAIAKVAESVHAHYLLRIIQDTFISKAAIFAADIASIVGNPLQQEWIAAAIERQSVSDHPYWEPYLSFCRTMRLNVPARIVFPQGAVMLAGLDVWQKYYLGLTKEMNHRFEDVLMGQWLLQSGGCFVPMCPTWRHYHDCNPVLSESIFNEQLEELPDNAILLKNLVAS
jgi:hypothetical protein